MQCHLARKDWIAASVFHPEEGPAALARIERRVEEAGGRPVVLLDLDETLYDTGHRNHAILKEWLASAESRPHRPVADALLELTAERMGYSMRDTFASIALDLARAEVFECHDALRRFWNPRFFSSAYVEHDRPYEGAAEFVRGLFERGADVIYMTGRNAPAMGEGTRRCLERDGFPMDALRTRLLMKPQPHHDDLAFKVERASDLRGHGEMVALLENEPRNLVALAKVFPAAMPVFVDTLCSANPAEPLTGGWLISGYERA